LSVLHTFSKKENSEKVPTLCASAKDTSLIALLDFFCCKEKTIPIKENQYFTQDKQVLLPYKLCF